MTGPKDRTLRFRRWRIVLTVAVLTSTGVPLAAAASAGNAERAGVPATAAENPMVTDIRKLIDRFIRLWNENKLDELVAGHYTDDAVLLPPNHEPALGRAAILAYIKRYRDVLGEFDKDYDFIRATPSGDAVSWVGQYSLGDGNVRITSHELYVRQPDGSMRSAIEMFGFRDPMG
jgi:ketosteroid isomerase-like protein